MTGNHNIVGRYASVNPDDLSVRLAPFATGCDGPDIDNVQPSRHIDLGDSRQHPVLELRPASLQPAMNQSLGAGGGGLGLVLARADRQRHRPAESHGVAPGGRSICRLVRPATTGEVTIWLIAAFMNGTSSGRSFASCEGTAVVVTGRPHCSFHRRDFRLSARCRKRQANQAAHSDWKIEPTCLHPRGAG